MSDRGLGAPRGRLSKKEADDDGVLASRAPPTHDWLAALQNEIIKATAGVCQLQIPHQPSSQRFVDSHKAHSPSSSLFSFCSALSRDQVNRFVGPSLVSSWNRLISATPPYTWLRSRLTDPVCFERPLHNFGCWTLLHHLTVARLQRR